MNNYYILKETAASLNDKISGTVISEIYSQEKNRLHIALTSSDSDNESLLEYSVDRHLNYIVLKNNFSKAKKNFAGLIPEAYGRQIQSVKLYKEDRIILFSLNDGYEIFFSFFSSKSNCFFTKNKVILSAFKDNLSLAGKNIDDVFGNVNVGKRGKVENDITAGDFIKSNYIKFGNLILNEVLYNLNLEKHCILIEYIREKINNEFNKIKIKLENPVYILYKKEDKIEISLIELTHLSEYDKEYYDNITSLIMQYIRHKSIHSKTAEIKKSLLNKLEAKLQSLIKKENNLRLQLEHCSDSGLFKMKGDLILMNMNEISKGQTEIILMNENGISIPVKLKPELTASENAKIYFEKYKKQKASVELLKRKLAKAAADKSAAESEIKKLNETQNIKLLMKDEKKEKSVKTDESSRFRKIKLNEKYEAWTGKDSLSNDLLTTKFTSQNELWFHVRGASGSHTVLKGNNKGEDIPKEIILKAAAVAAYFSKARNASSVPVAYCEKKYVKKKKGFKSGSVVMDREKVVFVKPELPEEI